MEKDFCKPLENSFYHFFKPQKISFWEKIALFFIKAEVFIDRVESVKTISKRFRGKIYIIDQYRIPPEGYNCKT